MKTVYAITDVSKTFRYITWVLERYILEKIIDRMQENVVFILSAWFWEIYWVESILCEMKI